MTEFSSIFAGYQNYEYMKYLIRSVKYFFYFSFICALIICALILTGLAEADINAIFRNGADDLVKIAGLFLLIAAFYPKVGFITRSVTLARGMKAEEANITAFMQEHGYKAEQSTENTLTYIRKGGFTRLVKMYEDRITLTETAGEVTVEGLRKDVVRIAMGLEYRFGPQAPEQSQTSDGQ